VGTGVGTVAAPVARLVTDAGTASAADRDDAVFATEAVSVVGEGPGDRSWTWRFPGHGVLDALSVAVPGTLGRHSPFLARLVDDGAQLRAMFGTLWSVLPLAGVALGAAAAIDTGGTAVPPALELLLAITALSVLDALSGAIATAVFGVVVLLWGSPPSGDDSVHPLLVVIGLGFLWTSLPLVGSATRPFRRPGARSTRYLWDRAADIVIASLLCAWIAQKLAGAMDGFAGRPTGVPAHEDAVALVVLALIALRLLVEQAATVWYPARLGSVDPEAELPRPTGLALASGIVIRTATFGFIGYAFIDLCWQWWLGTALFVVPQLAELARERCRTVPWVQRLLPRGLLELLVLVVVGTLSVRYAVHGLGDVEAIRLAYLVLAVPPALLGLLGLVGGEDPPRRATVLRELAGVVVLALTAWLVLRGWDY
jgi:hypothetical protein